MAEEEVRKHAKAAIKLAADRTKSWKHKLGDIGIEILIIIFAVTVSIWLHNWSESLKDRREERVFLTGLRSDLLLDEKEMESDRAGYVHGIIGLHYFERVGMGEPLDKDSLRLYEGVFSNFTQIIPRISRFEALKGSGKLDIIENKDLLLAITDLYQKLLPAVVRQNDYVNTTRDNNMFPFITDHLALDPKGEGTNWQEMLRMPKMRLMIRAEGTMNNNITRYTEAIAKAKEVLGMIEEELR